MSTPTSGPVDPFGPGFPYPGGGRLTALWLKPVEELLPIMVQTKDKPIGQFTMQELMSYVFASASLAGAMAGNLVRVAIRGR
jgi:hypothetical protein